MSNSKKKVLTIIAIFVVSFIAIFPSISFAQHHHGKTHLDYFSIAIPGVTMNYGYVPMYPPQQFFFQPPPIVYVPPQQLTRVCTPPYIVNTPQGQVSQQRCWNEWR